MKENKVTIFYPNGTIEIFSEGKESRYIGDEANTVKTIMSYGSDVHIYFESGRNIEFCGFQFIHEWMPDTGDDVPF
jgi:hypothetical protein